MRRAICPVLVALGAAAVMGAGDAPVSPREKVVLFNGKDTTGWVSVLKDTRVDAAKMWSVKDGILTIGGATDGYLRTMTPYKSYKVTVEWKFIDLGPHGNTGVMVHINGDDKVWPTCIECQGMHDHQGEFWIWGDAKIQEKFDKGNGVLLKKPSAEKPVGEWNTFTVVCKDKMVTIFVNGQEMNHITSTNLDSGTIGLQAEGATVAVRKVKLEPLD